MITHVPGPVERLFVRLGHRFEAWLDGLCVSEPAQKRDYEGGVPALGQPPRRGLPAILRAIEEGGVTGSVREIARKLDTSKSTVQRAKRQLQAA